jgi:hypothetical protein
LCVFHVISFEFLSGLALFVPWPRDCMVEPPFYWRALTVVNDMGSVVRLGARA